MNLSRRAVVLCHVRQNQDLLSPACASRWLGAALVWRTLPSLAAFMTRGNADFLWAIQPRDLPI